MSDSPQTMRLVSNVIPIPGKVVGLAEHQGRVILATESGVFEVVNKDDGTLVLEEILFHQTRLVPA